MDSHRATFDFAALQQIQILFTYYDLLKAKRKYIGLYLKLPSIQFIFDAIDVPLCNVCCHHRDLYGCLLEKGKRGGAVLDRRVDGLVNRGGMEHRQRSRFFPRCPGFNSPAFLAGEIYLRCYF